jgi:hypothetical protein
MSGGINEINVAVPAAESTAAGATAGLIGFLFAARGGDDLEQLILQDTAQQRKVANAIRTARREQQMRAALDAAAKLKEAAKQQLWPALTSTLINIGLCGLQCSLNLKPEDFWYKFIEAGKAGISSYLPPFSGKIAELQADAGVLQTRSDIYAQQAKDQSDWLQSARELEQRMISHLEKQIELDNRKPNL